jgi:hypothetical protein
MEKKLRIFCLTMTLLIARVMVFVFACVCMHEVYLNNRHERQLWSAMNEWCVQDPGTSGFKVVTVGGDSDS